MEMPRPAEVDRRRAPRRAVKLYFNKYIDGVPYACEALELSTSGMLIRKIFEPDVIRDAYAIEIGPEYALHEPRLWLYATVIWSLGPYEALGFAGPSRENRRRLEDLIQRSEPLFFSPPGDLQAFGALGSI
ncbi:MAG TPA: PilZ domain-containing protein [Polyangiaceae bacterium]|jgi:hypothetical protein|nr:PilZ domain-containing protein [Polyangiaceae bacterium]